MGPASAAAGRLLARGDRLLSWAEAAFIGAALAATSALLFVNVVLRYVFFRPLPWAEELTLYAMVWIVFVGGSVVVRTRGHIAVDVLPLMLSPAGARRLSMLVALVSLLFFTAFVYYSSQHTLRVRASGQVMPAMLAPMWLAYLAMPVGGALMALRTAQSLARLLAAGGRPRARLDQRD